MHGKRPLFLTILLVCLLLFGCDLAGQVTDGEPPARTVSFETNEGTALGFDISPDGETIVFDLLGQLWTLPADGGTAQPLTNAAADIAEDLAPSFSPDGRWIVFRGDRAGEVGIWRVPTDGDGEPELLSETDGRGMRDAPPAFSTDGRMVVFGARGRLHVHDIATGTTSPVELPEEEVRLEEPAWLAEGRLVAREASAGALWVVDPIAGTGTTLGTGGLEAYVPSPSPDGQRIAYLADDGETGLQLWVQEVAGSGEPVRLTDHEVFPYRPPRWTPDGTMIVFSADGGLWRVSALEDGRALRQITFTARIELERDEPPLPQIRFAEAGSEHPARGHMGLALSPDGSRIAAIALGHLWVWPVGGDPRSVAEVPLAAEWLSWSPDGTEVAWSAGPPAEQDIYATHVSSSHTRPITRLACYGASRPTWSPDGRSIALFLRRDPMAPGTDVCGDEDLPLLEHPQQGRFAVVPAHGEVVGNITDLFIPAPEKVFSLPGFHVTGQEKPLWAPSSDELILPAEREPAQVLALDSGESRPLRGLPEDATFLRWAADSSLVFVRGNRIWQTLVRGDSLSDLGPLTDDAGLYPSVANDGSVAYVGADGYRVRRPDGTVHRLGWPLTYHVPAPEPLLIREARVIDGTGEPPSALQDVLIEDGRIARIAPTGTITADGYIRVIEARGRTLLPGLIDLHQHGWDDDLVIYAGSLYHGVTTLREMGGPIARNAALGEAFEAGVFPGPRVVLGGYQIYPGSDAPAVSGASMQRPRNAEEGQRTLALAQAFGASYAKMREPGRWSAGAKLVRLAHARGLRIGGHCAHPLPLIAAGIRQVEHVVSCGPRGQAVYYEDVIRLFRESGVAVVPTLVFMRGRNEIHMEGERLLADPGVESFLTPLMRVWGGYDRTGADQAGGQQDWLRRGRDRVRTLHNAGVRIGTGTDIPMLPGAIHLELEELVAAGLTPLEAVRAATGSAARILGADEEIGTIEEGKRADLILLDADPLEDIRNTREIWKVIKGGEVVDREGILEWAREKQ